MKKIKRVLILVLVFAWLFLGNPFTFQPVNAASDSVTNFTASVSPSNPVAPGTMLSTTVSISGTMSATTSLYLEIDDATAGITKYNNLVTNYSTVASPFNTGTTVNMWAPSSYGITDAYNYKIKFCALNSGCSSVRYNVQVKTINITTANLPNYSISGKVTDGSGVGVSSANVYYSGTNNGNVTTDSSGNYTIANKPAGSYTVWPTKTNWTFTPQSRNVSTSSGNATSVNFSGVEQRFYTASGKVLNSLGTGIVNVMVNRVENGVSKGGTTTDTNGNYSFSGVLGGSTNTFTPVLAGYTFYPQWQTYAINADTSITNFQANLINSSPTLTGGAVSPSSGTVLDTFTFAITYKDPDGDPATVHKLYIDGTSYDMSGDANGNYSYQTKLATGSHSYSYEFSDGKNPNVTASFSNFNVTYDEPTPTNSVTVGNATIYADTFTKQSVKVYKATGNVHIGNYVYITGSGANVLIDENSASITGTGTVEVTGTGNIFTGDFKANADNSGLLPSLTGSANDIYINNYFKINAANIKNISFADGTVIGDSNLMTVPGCLNLVTSGIEISGFTIYNNGTLTANYTEAITANLGSYLKIEIPAFASGGLLTFDYNNKNLTANMNLHGIGPMSFIGDIFTANVSVGLGLESGDIVAAGATVKIAAEQFNALGVKLDSGWAVLFDVNGDLKINWKTGINGEAHMKIVDVLDIPILYDANAVISWDFTTNIINFQLNGIPWCVLAAATSESGGEPLCLLEAVDVNNATIDLAKGKISLNFEGRIPGHSSIPAILTPLTNVVSIGKVLIEADLNNTGATGTITVLKYGVTLGKYLGDYYIAMDKGTIDWKNGNMQFSGTMSPVLDPTSGILSLTPTFQGNFVVDKNGLTYSGTSATFPLTPSIPLVNTYRAITDANGNVKIDQPLSFLNAGIRIDFAKDNLQFVQGGLEGKGTLYINGVRQGSDINILIGDQKITLLESKAFAINGLIFVADKNDFQITSLGMSGTAEIRIPNLAPFDVKIMVNPDGSVVFTEKTSTNIVGVPVTNASLVYDKTKSILTLDADAQSNGGLLNAVVHLEIPVYSPGINGATGYMKGVFNYLSSSLVNYQVYGPLNIKIPINLGTLTLPYSNRMFALTTPLSIPVPIFGTGMVPVVPYSNYTGVGFNSATVLRSINFNWGSSQLSVYPAPTVSANPAGKTNKGALSVTLTASNSGSTIFYTVNGTNPTVNSTRYLAPINITKTTTLKFFAIDASGYISDVKTESYTIN